MNTALGFDLRWGFKQQAEFWQNESRRLIHLLRPEIETPLSVDRNVWPSQFAYDQGTERGEPDSSALRLSPTDTSQFLFRLWSDPEQMLQFYRQYKPDLETFNTIKILLCSTVTTERDEWQVLDALAPVKETDGFVIEDLGYDIAEAGFLSALTNCGYQTSEVEYIKSHWTDKLNDYGLFSSLNEAEDFVAFSDERVSEHGPFYVFLLQSLKLNA